MEFELVSCFSSFTFVKNTIESCRSAQLLKRMSNSVYYNDVLNKCLYITCKALLNK